MTSSVNTDEVMAATVARLEAEAETGLTSLANKHLAKTTVWVVLAAPLRERVRPAGGQGCFDLVDPGFQSRSADLLIRSSF